MKELVKWVMRVWADLSSSFAVAFALMFWIPTFGLSLHLVNKYTDWLSGIMDRHGWSY